MTAGTRTRAPAEHGAALDALRRLGLGDRVLAGDAACAAFASDALTAYAQRPAATVVVESRDEVVAVVRCCHEHGIPFVARGSGTSLSGGSLPVPGGVVIALNRMNRVLAVDPEARTATVEPGVINLHVTEAVRRHGLIYAPDPSSQSVCTIGGNLAFNSGGAHCLKHGMTSNHVLGLEAVLPDGEVVRLGGDGAEPVGPDWTGLFVGSEGLFGIATEVTLRLVPAAEHVHTALATFDGLEVAGDAVARVIAAGMLPVAMEIMDPLAIEAAEAAVGAGGFGVGEGGALLIVELDGERGRVEADAHRLRGLLEDACAREVRTTEDEAERALIWNGRKSAFSAVGWLAPDYLVQDGVVPRTRLGPVLAEIGRLGEEHGLRVANVFHAGDGNLHPLILFDGAKGELPKAEALAADVLRLCIAEGGSITGEHGVGVEKRELLPLMFGEDDLGLMRRLRDAVDPLHLANPGKMLAPDGDDASPGVGLGASATSAPPGAGDRAAR